MYEYVRSTYRSSKLSYCFPTAMYLYILNLCAFNANQFHSNYGQRRFSGLSSFHFSLRFGVCKMPILLFPRSYIMVHIGTVPPFFCHSTLLSQLLRH